ncbi:MAG: transporter [Hahellaceae bacterium]|nr:transporter [Hahellaceae bacterium]
MNRWVVPYCFLCAAALTTTFVHAENDASVDKARDALAKQEGDADSAKQLEEVFQAAEKNYSLLKKGGTSLTYSFDYSYFGDQRLDIEIVNSSVRNLDVTPSASHTFTNTFSIDYGLLDNVTLSARIPFSSKYDTQSELSNNDLGDVSLSLRWQPIPYVPGKVSYTVFGSFKTKTGVSPYEINVNRALASGSGYYSASAGLSASKVLDPVVLFGSTSFSYAFEEDGLNQVRGARLLRSVTPGFSVSFSGGFSYSLSYDVSMSASFQLSYSDQTELLFQGGDKAVAQDQVSSLVNVSLGTRVSEKTIINTNFGFGLTEDSPDVLIGVSMPINIAGLKE